MTVYVHRYKLLVEVSGKTAWDRDKGKCIAEIDKLLFSHMVDYKHGFYRRLSTLSIKY
jgi:hypothetical protein